MVGHYAHPFELNDAPHLPAPKETASWPACDPIIFVMRLDIGDFLPTSDLVPDEWP
jgi:hypothetical protein